MKRICLLSFIALSICISCHANKIDSLNSFRDVLAFLKTTFPKQTGSISLDTSAYSFSVTNRKVIDSLKINVKNRGRWLKADINNDGKSDLVLLRMLGLPSFVFVLAEKDGYSIHASSWFGPFHDLMESQLPLVKTINNQNAIIIYRYATRPRQGGYLNFRCDTLLFKYNRILSYQPHPGKYKIGQIKFEDNGVCEGDCPVINVVINSATNAGTYSVKYMSPPYKSFEGNIDSERVKAIFAIAEYTNMPDLTISQGEDYPYITDLTTATWHITYNGGEETTIEDYGHYGNAMLSLLYDEIVDDLPKGNK